MLLFNKKEEDIKDYLKVEYPVVEIFHSLQGEGFWAGVNAFFIRLAGCDVYCPWCDQKETWSMKKHPLFTVENLLNEINTVETKHIIITGGEPLLHNLLPLTKILKYGGYQTHLETSGSNVFTGEFDWVTLSPKPYKKPHESIYAHVDELKVVIDNENDLKWAASEAEKLPKYTVKYLQPQWENPASQKLVIDYILSHSQWRMSLQTHKYLNIL
ncbi:7-carboxy-7-deazaguanine synthase QueE [Cyanobacterium aponinum]|uniref:7-carboxy-7-deazaguanine synthase n=1 Tax=Cyanobacterium aponinum (strain PCC 10605) TaxID=755178 RepID=K9Z795_CYAAP|nr:7-carboxy-7-deazaguanine synthase QueE [Cyanobacterium aponinum]AFZ55071.1 Radical SAM domain protein [Cyanobacterium aponinum PCC 10605]PHV63569.1 7-carboxy-7-deazaguanine synthase QueE [Cyanobacterium aponinum IPPAS B-1201]